MQAMMMKHMQWYPAWLMKPANLSLPCEKQKSQVQQEGDDEVPPQKQKPEIQQQQQQNAAEDATTNQNVKNPPRTKPKGRPKFNEPRRKPLVELRDDANKKRRKKESEPK